MCLFGVQLILCFLSSLFHLINLIELALGIVDDGSLIWRYYIRIFCIDSQQSVKPVIATSLFFCGQHYVTR